MIINADRDTLTITEDQNTYSGAKDYYQITFRFSEDWDAFAVRHAVFIRSAAEVEDVMIPSNGVVEIPNVLLEYESAIEIGCYGISGEIRRTTNLVKLIVEEGSYRAGERAVPAPDIFQQYLDQIIAYTGNIDFDSALKDVPAGGATGQVLAKKSDTDFDTEWRTESAQQQGIPTGGSSGQVLAKASASDYDVTWQDDAQTDSLVDTAVTNTSSDSRYTGLSTQKLINEKISTDITAKADAAHNHDSEYLGISHGSQTDNPHGVTKTHVGLGNADNTSDMNKPVSTAVQAAINNVDQVFSYTNLAAFPASGAAETIYIAEDTNRTYRWTGSAYAEIGDGTGDGSSGREVLTEDITYYVDPVDGSDSNTGLSTSVPFLTIQKAIDETAALDLGIYDVTIDLWTAVGTGIVTYSITTAIELKKLIGAGEVTIQGNISDQTSVVITGSSSISFVEAESINGYTIKSLSFIGDSGLTNSAISSKTSALTIDSVYFKDLLYGLSAEQGAQTKMLSTHESITLEGSVSRAFSTAMSSVTIMIGTAFNTTNLTTMTYFVMSIMLSLTDARVSTYTATAITGTKYYLTLNSVLNIGSVVLPGNTAGVIYTGSQVA